MSCRLASSGGSSEEFDVEGEEPVSKVPPTEEADKAPQIDLQEVTLVHEDQLAHISGCSAISSILILTNEMCVCANQASKPCLAFP